MSNMDADNLVTPQEYRHEMLKFANIPIQSKYEFLKTLEFKRHFNIYKCKNYILLVSTGGCILKVLNVGIKPFNLSNKVT